MFLEFTPKKGKPFRLKDVYALRFELDTEELLVYYKSGKSSEEDYYELENPDRYLLDEYTWVQVGEDLEDVMFRGVTDWAAREDHRCTG